MLNHVSKRGHRQACSSGHLISLLSLCYLSLNFTEILICIYIYIYKCIYIVTTEYIANKIYHALFIHTCLHTITFYAKVLVDIFLCVIHNQFEWDRQISSHVKFKDYLLIGSWDKAMVIGIDTKIEVIVVSPTTWEAHPSPRANNFYSTMMHQSISNLCRFGCV